MKWSIVFLLTLSLCGCSAEWHLTRAIKKNPLILKADTTSVVDTVVLPPVALTDTVILSKTDTVTLTKDRVKIEIVRNYDTIQVDAICDSDTIVRVVEVPYEKVVYVEEEASLDKAIDLAILLIVFFIAFRVMRLFSAPRS